MSKLITFAIIFSIFGFTNMKAQTFYDYKVKTIDGESFDLASLKGKKVLVVNTASKCGYTGQYADLEKLYNQFKNNDFIIIGFPANNFMNQEPGSNEEIKQFCTLNYGVSFPMMEKISVKGDDMAPLYKWLTNKSLNGVMDSKVKWNFQKYLIDENGKLVTVFDTKTNPLSEEVINYLK